MRMAGSASGTPATDSAPSVSATPPLMRLASALVPPISSVRRSWASTAAPTSRAPTTPPAGPDNARLAARFAACSGATVPPLDVMIRSDFTLGERVDGAVGSHALPGADHVPAGHEWLGMMPGEIVQRRAVLAAQPQEVLKAGRRHQHDARTAALEQRVGRDGRAMNQDIDALCPERLQGPQQPQGGVLRRAPYFADLENAIGPDCDEIGERPADVDADARHGRKRRLRSSPAPPSVSTTTSVPTQSPSRT